VRRQSHPNNQNTIWISAWTASTNVYICEGDSPYNFAHINCDEPSRPNTWSSQQMKSIFLLPPHLLTFATEFLLSGSLYRTNIHLNFPTSFWATSNLKMAVFWDVAPCSLVDINRRFREAYFFHHHGATSQKTAIFILVVMRTWNFFKYIGPIHTQF
jgi:hypothetical protein